MGSDIDGQGMSNTQKTILGLAGLLPFMLVAMYLAGWFAFPGQLSLGDRHSWRAIEFNGEWTPGDRCKKATRFCRLTVVRGGGGVELAILLSAHQGEPQIDPAAIKSILERYEFPLYFFDYETFASAVPLVDGASPHKHFPVQYSLHILEEDGTLSHKEFLQREARLPANLIEQMEMDFGPDGSIVSWHASFEKTQNREMARWFPEKADFLNDINDRMVDLEDIFKKSYVDAQFDGSTSIKKVLPVLCPHLGYDGLEVQDGASAMDAWQKMINAHGEEADAIAANLLKYCKLDTFAMVEIYRFIANLVEMTGLEDS